MDAQVLNWKAYSSGSLVGFFDLSVCGLVVCGCRAFQKDGKLWFGFPSEKREGKDGATEWRDIVTAAEPAMRHLQNIVRGQLRACLEANEAAPQRSARPAAGTGFKGTAFAHPDKAYQESRRAAQAADDLPF